MTETPLFSGVFAMCGFLSMLVERGRCHRYVTQDKECMSVQIEILKYMVGTCIM